MATVLDRSIVRIVVVMTVLSWASVLAHDVLDRDAAQGSSMSTASVAPEDDAAAPPTTVPSVPVPPTNGTTPPDAFAPAIVA